MLELKHVCNEGGKKLNASFYPKMTELLREISGDIAKDIIKEGKPIILVDEYSWYKETLSLMAKQVNLCDSCLLLLENGMEQEAYLLARSQFNNMLWIKYICEDDGNSRVKEYFYQPHIGRIMTNKNLKKMIEEYGQELEERFLETDIIEGLNQGIDENTQILSRENIPIKIKSIADLSRQNSILFGMYITLYNEGSKFEHSDISKTRLYRKQAIENYNTDQIFIFDLGTSNRECWLTVFRYSLMSMFFAFESIWDRIKNKEEQLFWKTNLGEAAYTEENFKNILLKFGICQELLNECADEK